MFNLFQNYPEEEVPEFRSVMPQLYKEGANVAMKVLELLGYALKLEVRSHIAQLSDC